MAEFKIRGTAPYVQHKFSTKMRQQMKEKQEAGEGGPQGKKKRAAKDFKAAYEQAMYISVKGWHEIPAASFRNAMISACRTVNFKMTHSKLAVFILADGYDPEDGTALVKITKGKPQYAEHTVRLASGVADIRFRPMWQPGWEAIVRIRFDSENDEYQRCDTPTHASWWTSRRWRGTAG